MLFIAYFIIAIITGILNSKIRENELIALEQEQNTNFLYQQMKKLSNLVNKEEIVEEAINTLNLNFNIESNFYLLNELENLNNLSQEVKNKALIEWSFKNKKNVGKNTTILKDSSKNIYISLFTNTMNIGVLEIKSGTIIDNKKKLFNAYISQVCSAIEKEYLNEEAKKSNLIKESERLYSTLFNSISHELKIPISTLKASSENLKDKSILEDEQIRDEIIDEIARATQRLNKLVSNLLDMSRLESGLIKANIDWYDINDLVNSVINVTQDELKSENIKVNINNIEIAKFDFGLIEQVLFNMINNSVIYNSKNVIININFYHRENNLIIEFLDNGSGISEDKINNIFTKFYRIDNSKTGGSGLGLSIVKGFIEAHKGNIKAENIYIDNNISGLKFIITIPQN